MLSLPLSPALSEEDIGDAIAAHGAAGMLFIAASGNDGLDTDVSARFPQGYASSNVISVGASNSADGIAIFSNHGRRTVDVPRSAMSNVATAGCGALRLTNE